MSTEKRPAMNGASNLGYAMAILLPIVGLLVGLALIARGESDGAWIVGFSVACGTLYSAILFFALF